jgi:hypothetical protein
VAEGKYPSAIFNNLKLLFFKDNESIITFMSIDDIYTPLEEAREEIQRRWNDPVLRKKVNDFLGGDVPQIFLNEPHSVLVRDIITPNNEFRFFWDMVKEMKMKTIFVEYTSSKFVAKNINKYHLCNLHCYEGIGKKGGEKVSRCKIVDFNKMEGKPLKDITTLNGEKLLDFHHDMLFKKYPEINKADIYDFYDWFNEHRNVNEYYYLHYLALFICYGVLFDNFILSNGEKDFTENKILPSFYKLQEIFGVKPLIVPATPIECENNLFWWFYKGKIK